MLSSSRIRWQPCTLRDLIHSVDAGVSANCHDFSARNGELSVLKTSCVAKGRFIARENKVVLEAEKARLKTAASANSIIFCRKNTDDFVGASAFVEQDHDTLFLPDLLWRITAEKHIDPRWLSYLIASPIVKNIVRSRATGTHHSMKNVAQDALLTIEVLKPSFNEQRRIAEILRTWDEAIDKTERLIAAKAKRLLWLSNALLFGDIRCGGRKTASRRELRWFQLPTDWGTPHIADIAEQSNLVNKAGEDLPVLSCTKYDGLVESLKYFGRKVYSEDTSAYRVVERGQFAYATNHLEEGSIGYQDLCDRGLVSPMYTAFKADTARVNDRYLLRAFKTGTYLHIFQANTSASVDRRGGLRWEDFSRIRVPLPSLDEQDEIDRVLSTAQAEIGQVKAQSVALQKQKRGLMQKLLTGEWAVPSRDSDVDDLTQRAVQVAAE